MISGSKGTEDRQAGIHRTTIMLEHDRLRTQKIPMWIRTICEMNFP